MRSEGSTMSHEKELIQLIPSSEGLFQGDLATREKTVSDENLLLIQPLSQRPPSPDY